MCLKGSAGLKLIINALLFTEVSSNLGHTVPKQSPASSTKLYLAKEISSAGARDLSGTSTDPAFPPG